MVVAVVVDIIVGGNTEDDDAATERGIAMIAIPGASEFVTWTKRVVTKQKDGEEVNFIICEESTVASTNEINGTRLGVENRILH